MMRLGSQVARSLAAAGLPSPLAMRSAESSSRRAWRRRGGEVYPLLALTPEVSMHARAGLCSLLRIEYPLIGATPKKITITYAQPKTFGWKATLMVVNTVGHLAEVAWEAVRVSMRS